MRLFEEYMERNCPGALYARRVEKGFLYFDSGARLLVIEWMSPERHPGFYEFSECELTRRCRTVSSRRVEWDEYESYVRGWMSTERAAVFDRGVVFDLTWQYFLRRHEGDILGAAPISQVYKTVDESNDSRLLDCFGLLETISSRAPSAVDFWRSRAFQIVSLYCHWMSLL